MWRQELRGRECYYVLFIRSMLFHVVVFDTNLFDFDDPITNYHLYIHNAIELHPHNFLLDISIADSAIEDRLRG